MRPYFRFLLSLFLGIGIVIGCSSKGPEPQVLEPVKPAEEVPQNKGVAPLPPKIILSEPPERIKRD
jgi:hypothetical protein